MYADIEESIDDDDKKIFRKYFIGVSYTFFLSSLITLFQFYLIIYQNCLPHTTDSRNIFFLHQLVLLLY